MRVKDARQTFLGIWIKQLIEGEPIEISATARRCAISTTSTMWSMRCCWRRPATGPNGQVFNLGSDETISLRDWPS